MKAQDTYREAQTINFNGMVARVYRPILTEDERAKRIAEIHKQAANLLKSQN